MSAWLCGTVALFGLISSAQADLVNPSFEDPALDDGGWTNTVTGWTVYWGDHRFSAPGILNPQDDQFPGSSGTGNLPCARPRPDSAPGPIPRAHCTRTSALSRPIPSIR